MRRRAALLTAVLSAATLSTTGCGVLMRFIGDRVADAITQKTGNLQDVAAKVEFTTNLYPADAQTYETQAVEKDWKAGANLITVVFQKRAGIGMWEIDGTVVAKKAGGQPVPLTYFGKGSYFLFLPPNDKAPRTIEVRSATGQVASFLVKPAAPVKLKAVNGKAANAAVDLTKDLVIDLEDVGPGKLKVMLAATTLGIRTMTDVAIARPAKHIVVPAAAFKHMGVTASAAGFVGVDAGANYVVVERYEGSSVAAPGAAGAAFTIGKSWSHQPVTVTGDVKNAVAMQIEGEVPNPRGSLIYAVHKPQAFYGPPLHRARSIALGSLELRGVLFKQTSSSSQRYGYDNTIITTTTTTTYAFPKVAPVAWDRLLEDAAGDLGAVFKGLGGNAVIVPPEKVLAAPTYKLLDVATEHVSDTLVEKSYRKTRPLFPVIGSNAFAAVSSTFALDRPFVRVLREAGADALLATSIDLQIGTKQGTEKIVLVPRLKFSLIGGANGYAVGPTTYATGWVAAHDGVAFSKAELEDIGALRRIARLDDLMAGLKGALMKVREEEKKAGYDAIWALQ